MPKLKSPVRRYLVGKLPSHSSSVNLHKNFKEIPQAALVSILNAKSYMTEEGKPTKHALDAGLVDSCDKIAIWNLAKVEKILLEAGLKPTRVYVNQEISEPDSLEPTWVNLTTISTYFDVTPSTIGKWLDELELREQDGLPTKEAQDKGLGMVSEMSAGKKKTRKIAMWESYLTRKILRDQGRHPLDFDYEKSLAARGRNSAVEVNSIDSRVDELAKEFIKAYKKRDKNECNSLVKKTPKALLVRLEKRLKKPAGWLTLGKYKEKLS